MKIFSNLHDEARARITWGENPGEVRAWLSGEGLTEEESAALVNTLWKERTAEVRSSAMAEIKWALGILISEFSWLSFRALDVQDGRLSIQIPELHDTELFVCLLAALLFCCLLVHAMIHLISGRKEGSITEWEKYYLDDP